MITHFRQAIEETLPWLSSFGADPAGGMTRLLYSPEWLETQQQFKKRMAASGLETQYGAPLRTVEVVAMAEEEGSRFPYVFWGSKNIFGLANPDDVRNICDAKGNSFVDAMKACGFTLPNAPLTPRQDIKAFVELHIEQGCVLESNGQSIGVVNAIVGQRRYTVTLNGESNHAGTTPMGYRRDTVYAFSRICHQSVEKAKRMGDPLVLTFGKVEPRPNTVNVVPGKTTFTIDCRHTDAAVLRDFTQQLGKVRTSS